MFTNSMVNKPWRERFYIDLFSGPGKCVLRENGDIILGSPLISLAIPHPFTSYIFIDENKECIDALKIRCKSHEANKNITYENADGNKIVNNIVKRIKAIDNIFIKGKWSSINLAFLDPNGLELEWSTIEALSEINKMDLIIHYSQSGLTRNLELCCDDPNDNVIDKFFGDKNWRGIHKQNQIQSETVTRAHSQLIDYYKKKLANLGYIDIHTLGHEPYDPLVRTSQTKAPLYRLLFASKNRLGHDFWGKVTQKDAYGQTRLF